MRKERIVNIKHILEERELMKEVQEFKDIPSEEQEKSQMETDSKGNLRK